MLFHVLSVFSVGAIGGIYLSYILRYRFVDAPVAWSRLFDLSMIASAIFVPLLLVPSIVGWWLGGRVAAWAGLQRAAALTCRGLFAALLAFLIHIPIVGEFYPPSILALPLGMFFAWLVFGVLTPLPNGAPSP